MRVYRCGRSKTKRDDSVCDISCAYRAHHVVPSARGDNAIRSDAKLLRYVGSDHASEFAGLYQLRERTGEKARTVVDFIEYIGRPSARTRIEVAGA